jgi:hypothetical protein
MKKPFTTQRTTFARPRVLSAARVNSYMLAKSWAVELIASSTSGNIKEPDRNVIVPPAFIFGVTPSSLKNLVWEQLHQQELQMQIPPEVKPQLLLLLPAKPTNF